MRLMMVLVLFLVSAGPLGAQSCPYSADLESLDASLSSAACVDAESREDLARFIDAVQGVSCTEALMPETRWLVLDGLKTLLDDDGIGCAQSPEGTAVLDSMQGTLRSLAAGLVRDGAPQPSPSHPAFAVPPPTAPPGASNCSVGIWQPTGTSKYLVPVEGPLTYGREDLKIVAQGNPDGGTFLWSLGSENAGTFEAVGAVMVLSLNYDTEVTVTYTISGATCRASVAVYWPPV